MLPVSSRKPQGRARLAAFVATTDSLVPTLLRVSLGGVIFGLLVHLPNGVFINWGGAPHGEGYEVHLLAMAMAASLVLSGGGRASLDGWLQRRLRATSRGA